MSFGKKIAEVRKKIGLSQAELAKRVGTQAPVIGRYERDIAKPSIEVSMKIAKALNVSLDYLVGNTELELDQNTLKRIEDISKMDSEEQNKIFMVVDALIRDFKLRKLANS
jgi:transcriptional regulator with XRE-family HTH domain